MSTIEFEATNLMFEKNLIGLSHIGRPSTVRPHASFLIPITEICAFSFSDIMYSEQKRFTLLLKNGTTVVVSLDMKNCQKYFDNFIEAWKSLFDSKPPDLLSLIKTNLEENKKLRDEFLKFKEESTSKFHTNTETADLLSLV